MTNKTAKSTAKIQTAQAREAGSFTKRIGYTVYHVGVHFSGTNNETAQDKIVRLVKTEAMTGRAKKP